MSVGTVSDIGATARPAGEPPRPLTGWTRALVPVAALLVALAVIAVFDLILPDVFANVLIDRDRSTYPFTVQNLMWLIFFLGLAELGLRYRDARAERRYLTAGLLPEDETTILQARDLRDVYARAKPAAGGGSGAYLPRLVLRVVSQVQLNRSIDQATAVLNASLELFQHEIDLRYNIIRYVVWVIPTLGFVGTVIGISLALAFAGQVDVQDPTLLAELTTRLAVAFNTTLLALLMSAVVVLVQHLVQRYEEGGLNAIGQYCLDHLINRLLVE